MILLDFVIAFVVFPIVQNRLPNKITDYSQAENRIQSARWIATIWYPIHFYEYEGAKYHPKYYPVF